MIYSILGIAVILMAVWLLGFLLSYTIGGALQLLLALSLVMIAYSLFSRRKTSKSL
jgi:membrane protein implicated in regulation of membrane protease activity